MNGDGEREKEEPDKKRKKKEKEVLSIDLSLSHDTLRQTNNTKKINEREKKTSEKSWYIYSRSISISAFAISRT